jgi:glycosyltransferase involved in cell wall biosynthesis
MGTPVSKVFIILSTDHIGGAEKRFVGLWQALCEKEEKLQAMLVVSPGLFSILQQQEDFAGVLNRFRERILQFDPGGGFKKFQSAVKDFVSGHTSENDILHFIGDHPLLPGLKRKQVYSITQSSLKNLNAAGKTGQLGGVAFSDVTDILDPLIFKQMRRIFFFKRHKFFRTTNSFCDVNLFQPLPFEQKKDWLVFLGRFEPMKQVKQLLEMMPSVYEAIRTSAVNDLHFYLFGHGAQEAELRDMLKEERYRGLPITIGFNSRPYEVLAQSKVFFSLQLHNNYPSRSLIEAMAAGNIPLVTDVGQTRWLAKPEFSYYVPEHFVVADMVKAVNKIFSEDAGVLARKSAEARQFVLDEHTVEKMADYYKGLYRTCFAG